MSDNWRCDNAKSAWHFSRFRKCLALLTAGLLSLPPVPVGVWADELDVKEDLTVEGTGGTLKNPNVEVKGNAAVQKDLYVHEGLIANPFGGLGNYANLLTYSEDLTQTGSWTRAGLDATTPVALNATAPDGKANGAVTMKNGAAANGTLAQTATASASTAYTASLWVKAGTSTTLDVVLAGDGNAVATTSSVTLTANWQRVSATHTTGSTSANITLTLKNTGAGATTILLWGAQLEKASTPGVYAKTTATAVTASRGLVSNTDLLVAGTQTFTGNTTVSGNLAVNGNTTLGDASTDTVTLNANALTFANASTVALATSTTALNIASGLLDLDTTNSRVGIGTTAPGYKLHVAGATDIVDVQGATNAFYRATNKIGAAAATGDFSFGVDDGSGAGANAFIIYDRVNGAYRFVLNNAGNVGIGTTSPSAVLHVSGAGTPLKLNSTDSQFTKIQLLDAGTVRSSVGADATYAFNVQDNLGNDRLTVRQNGNVGIGVPGAGSKLAVSGNATVGAGYGSTAAPTNGLLVEGNVGLGTTSPTGLLHLAGNRSAAAWGLNGIQLQNAAATFTDSSTAASGTATNAVVTSFAQPTLAATNTAVTTTNAATVYIANAPAAGTNQTLTNAYALWVDAGNARFDGVIQNSVGAVSAPSYTFQGNTDTGVYQDGANSVAITAGGTQSLRVQNNQVRLADNGSAGAPNLAFVSDTNTGIFNDAADTLGFSTGGAERLSISPKGNVTFTQGISTSGSPSALLLTGAAHTGLTASTEAPSVKFNLGQTIQFATGALTNQRAFQILAPTYAFAAASTLTNAATLYIDAAPAAGTNATITNPYALWVDAGNARFDGTLITNSQAAVQIEPFSTAAGNTGEARYLELAANGTNYVGVKAPDSIAANTVWTLPAADSTGTQCLSSNGSGVLAWAACSGGAANNPGGSGSELQYRGGASTFSAVSGSSITSAGGVTLAQSAVAGGQTALQVTPGAHTAVIAEVIDYNLAAHADTITGGYTTQRFALFAQPTITAASALTVTNAATVAIANAPAAAGSAVITNPYALWVQAGNVRLDGQIIAGSSNTTLTDSAGKVLSAALNTVAVAQGGTGQTSYTDGQLLIGNSTGNTLAKATLTGTANQVTVTNGSGSITLATPQDLATASTPQFARLGIGAAADGTSKVLLAGNATAAAWGLNGIQLQHAAATFTDSSTAASGTATNAVVTSFAQPTLAATNTAVTTTNAATVYIANAPAAGTNQTLTNAYALWVDAGNARFDGTLITTSQAAVQIEPFSTAAGNTGEARYLELAANGTNYVGVKAPDSIAANTIWTLPAADSTGTQCLSSNGSGVLAWAACSGGSGTPGGASTQVQFNDAGTFGGSANLVFDKTNVKLGIGTASPASKLDVTTTALATTQTDTSGLAVVNTTAAAVGAQQISPAVRWRGFGWKTDATAASQSVDFRSYVVPVQGAANPTGYLTFESSVNGAAYANALAITSAGNVGLGTASPTGLLHLAGNRSAAAWGLNGIQLQNAAATFTDSSTAASGTATNAVVTSFAQPTLAATNTAVTTTNAATVYIANAPAAGTNQTLTNPYALWVDAGNARFDGQVLAANGSAGAPSYSFTSSANSGMYINGSTLELVSGGTEMIKVYPNQIVVGVLGSASVPAINHVTSGNTGIFWPTSTSLGISANGVERIRIDSSGNVGIGTTSPQATLDVQGSLRVKTTSVAANYTVAAADAYIFVDANLAARTITLPAASANTVGRVLYVCATDTGGGFNSVTVAAAGTDTVNGAASVSTANAYDCIRVVGRTSTAWLATQQSAAF